MWSLYCGGQMLSKRLMDFSKGGVDKEEGEVSGIQSGRY